jgi:WhiB family redox-sensing transcriptional regulator
MTGIDWRLRGNCSTRTAEEFFPLSYGSEYTKAAKALCERSGGCPVKDTCLKWAVDNHVAEGVWGGRTAKEREKYGTGPMPAAAAPAEPKPRGPRGPFKPNCDCGQPKVKSRNGGRDRWICPPCDAAKSRRWRSSRERVPS